MVVWVGGVEWGLRRLGRLLCCMSSYCCWVPGGGIIYFSTCFGGTLIMIMTVMTVMIMIERMIPKWYLYLCFALACYNPGFIISIIVLSLNQIN